MAKSQRKEKGATEYAREALTEWGKAARYGIAAIAAKRHQRADGERPLGELVERFRPGGDEAHGSLASVELPIQASIDIAIPMSAVFALCTQLDAFPEFLDRVQGVEVEGDRRATVTARVGGRLRELEIEILDERSSERLDWECREGFEHSGVISLHPLAPRLTRLELTVERQPEGLMERATRRIGLTQRTIREELHRFKAYAELWEEGEEYEPEEAGEPIGSNEVEEEEVEPEEEEPEGEEDEEPGDEELEDEEEDEELEDEEELEAAESGRS